MKGCCKFHIIVSSEIKIRDCLLQTNRAFTLGAVGNGFLNWWTNLFMVSTPLLIQNILASKALMDSCHSMIGLIKDSRTIDQGCQFIQNSKGLNFMQLFQVTTVTKYAILSWCHMGKPHFLPQFIWVTLKMNITRRNIWGCFFCRLCMWHSTKIHVYWTCILDLTSKIYNSWISHLLAFLHLVYYFI